MREVLADAASAGGAGPAAGSGLAWRRFRRNRRLLVGSAIVAAFLLVTLFAPGLSPRDPLERDLANTLQAPSRRHLLGTDELGRDLLSRILYGARITLGISTVALLVSAASGILLGTTAGYIGGRWDNLAMRLVDVQLSFPGIVLAIAVIAVMGRGLLGLAVALSIFPIPSFARLARAATLVENSRTTWWRRTPSASPAGRSFARHILPNVLGPILVQAKPEHRQHHPGGLVARLPRPRGPAPDRNGGYS